jgi:hypothetical protein
MGSFSFHTSFWSQNKQKHEAPHDIPHYRLISDGNAMVF